MAKHDGKMYRLIMPTSSWDGVDKAVQLFVEKEVEAGNMVKLLLDGFFKTQ